MGKLLIEKGFTGDIGALCMKNGVSDIEGFDSMGFSKTVFVNHAWVDDSGIINTYQKECTTFIQSKKEVGTFGIELVPETFHNMKRSYVTLLLDGTFFLNGRGEPHYAKETIFDVGVERASLSVGGIHEKFVSRSESCYRHHSYPYISPFHPDESPSHLALSTVENGQNWR